jgi:hypothetical protein
MVQRGAVSGDASIWLKENWLPGEVRHSLCASLIWDLQLDTLSKSQVYELRDLFLVASKILETTI